MPKFSRCVQLTLPNQTVEHAKNPVTGLKGQRSVESEK